MKHTIKKVFLCTYSLSVILIQIVLIFFPSLVSSEATPKIKTLLRQMETSTSIEVIFNPKLFYSEKETSRDFTTRFLNSKRQLPITLKKDLKVIEKLNHIPRLEVIHLKLFVVYSEYVSWIFGILTYYCRVTNPVFARYSTYRK